MQGEVDGDGDAVADDIGDGRVAGDLGELIVVESPVALIVTWICS